MRDVWRDWKIQKKQIERLPHIQSVLSYPPAYFEQRLQKIGFIGKNTKLLDAACGSGVWAIAASKLNKEIYGIDTTERYLAVGQKIQKQLKIKNLKLQIGQLEKLPYPNEYFDYVVCYDAWMYTDRSVSIKEIKRVLKPKGKIYLGSIAGFGWYLNLLFEGIKKSNHHLIMTAVRAIKNRIYMTEAESLGLVKSQGFEILGVGSDASLGESKIKIKPMFQDKVLGFWCVYEILAEKEKLN